MRYFRHIHHPLKVSNRIFSQINPLQNIKMRKVPNKYNSKY